MRFFQANSLTRKAFAAPVKLAMIGAIAIGSMAAAAPASAEVLRFLMFDHPDGALADAPDFKDYGIRLDGLNPNTFFSAGADAANSTVQLSYDTTALTFKLEGTVRRNRDNSIWTLDYGMSGLTNGAAGPDVDFGAFGASVLTSDTLSCFSGACNGEADIPLGRKSRSDNLFFAFGATNDFAPGFNNDEFGVVRGGIMTATGWVDGSGTNDILMAGQIVPLPAPILLLASAMFGLGVLTRRRRT